MCIRDSSNIALDEINTVIEYEEMTNSLAFGSMEILSWLVFLFGVINLINTKLSNQIARKQENSILRSIGLTQKQLCKMNICEGLCYASFAILATLIVGLPASIFACRKDVYKRQELLTVIIVHLLDGLFRHSRSCVLDAQFFPVCFKLLQLIAFIKRHRKPPNVR